MTHRQPTRFGWFGLLLSTVLFIQLLEPVVSEKLKSSSEDSFLDDEPQRALATVISPGSKVARQYGAENVGSHLGTSFQGSVRHIRDWEVDDFFLLATVDGTLHARDRRTGKLLWALHSEKPVVETIDHREGKGNEADESVLWIVEPKQDGGLYLFSESTGLTKMDLTVKDLVEKHSPFQAGNKVYNGDKRTVTYAIDTASGEIKRMFSTGGSQVNNADKCTPSGALNDEEDECDANGENKKHRKPRKSKVILIGRTEYTVTIQNEATGELIWTIKYTEWGPNNNDRDLMDQYQESPDNRYIYARFDGTIQGFDHNPHLPDIKALFRQHLSSPAVRVFDVVRPVSADHDNLLLLPQPTGPIDNEDQKQFTYVGCTEQGGWFAMSEDSYPLITDGGKKAKYYISGLKHKNTTERKRALIGVHTTNALPVHAPIGMPGDTHYVKGLPAGNGQSIEGQIATINGREKMDYREFYTGRNQQMSNFPRIAPSSPGQQTEYSWLRFDNLMYVAFLTILVYIIRNQNNMHKILAQQQQAASSKQDIAVSGRNDDLKSPLEVVKEAVESADGVRVHIPEADVAEPTSKEPTGDDKEGWAEVGSSGDSPVQATKPSVHFDAATLEKEKEKETEISTTPEAEQPATPKRRKAHRGYRGGKKKKKNAAASAEEDKGEVDRIVDSVKEINPEQKGMEPDVAVTGSASNVDGTSELVINSLKITEEILGYGSHGTVVFRGTFESRAVAVKRMLNTFYDLASHEVRLLQESDFHRNVIRYYCQQSHANFMYIALELCAASLQEVVEKPHLHPDVVGYLDPTQMLHQIVSGVRHLHSLKIVHRDLKPQNILVQPPKRKPKENTVEHPRLVISDFGLCKKLEGEQSSFRATTAHAAGTAGWRAPELLTDEDAGSTSGSQGGTITGYSDASGSESAVVIDPLTHRRATRAIDIFSLGCVFYYVLTSGQHPFGDRYFREANIVRNRSDLSGLSLLPPSTAALAEDLISRMIAHNPRERPDAKTVMKHPYFWSAERQLSFLLDVSDFFEAVPRDPPHPYLVALETGGEEVVGGDWYKHLDPLLIENLGKYRKYNGGKVLDLLRALRNKKHHYQDLPEKLRKGLGEVPAGFLSYFAGRFPTLLLHSWKVVVSLGISEEGGFKRYFIEEGGLGS